MEFKWNSDKAAINLKKHSVSFQEAATVFNDPLSITFPDPDHSVGESRYIIIGVSKFRQLLVVAHADPDFSQQVLKLVNSKGFRISIHSY